MELLQTCSAAHRLKYMFPKPGTDAQVRISIVLNTALKNVCRQFGGQARLEIGISHVPWSCILMTDYAGSDRVMYLALVSGRSDFIAAEETKAIQTYRKFGYGGTLYNADGHSACENRIGGGGSAHHGVSSFFPSRYHWIKFWLARFRKYWFWP